MPYLSETEHQKLLHDLIKAEKINAELLASLKDCVKGWERAVFEDMSRDEAVAIRTKVRDVISKYEVN